MKKKRLILGLAITGAIFVAIFLVTFFAAGTVVIDDPLWVQYLFIISGAIGVGSLFTSAVIAVGEIKKRMLEK